MSDPRRWLPAYILHPILTDALRQLAERPDELPWLQALWPGIARDALWTAKQRLTALLVQAEEELKELPADTVSTCVSAPHPCGVPAGSLS